MTRSEQIAIALDKMRAAEQELRELLEGLTMKDLQRGLARAEPSNTIGMARRALRGRRGLRFDVGSLFALLPKHEQKAVGSPAKLCAAMRELKRGGIVERSGDCWTVRR
jgi:hypothetical protein